MCDPARRRWLGLFPACVAAGAAPAWAQRTVVEVIEPRFRDADELVAMLRPLVGPDGAVNTVGGRIVVRTTPETLTELRRVLAAVDTPPRLLEISVAQDVDAVLLQEGAVLDERAARIFSSRSAAGQTGIQVLRVYEGAVASTVTDRVPVAPAVTVVPGPSRRRAIPVPTTPPSSTSGFEARARVHGDRVSVEVSNVGRRLSPRAGGTVETQVLETVIHGRLGEWLPVGGTGRVRDADTDAIRYRSGDAARDIRRTWIKVDLVPEDTRDAR